MTRKATIGDICEINTPAGRAYIQYTHDGRDMGELVRVLPGLFRARPADFGELAKQRELYFIFYTLNYALRDSQADVVSHQPVPDWAQAYPLMRWPATQDQSGKTVAWKIFSASSGLTIEEHQRTPVLRKLTAEQEKLSIHTLRPHPIMVKELARGWTPERADDLRLQDVAEAEARRANQPLGNESSEHPMRHYLYFPEKRCAEKAGQRLKNRGFSVEIRRGADGENWLALATSTPPKTGEQMEELRNDMEALAAEFNGEYDGWESAIDLSGPASGEPDQMIN